LEKSSLTNLIFSLFQTGFLVPVFAQLDFSNLIFQNSSTDKQGDSIHSAPGYTLDEGSQICSSQKN
jgi:hypothetical protein